MVGFCRLEFDVEALYFHREDLEAALAKNSVRLALEWPLREEYRDLKDVYVIVEGQFTEPAPSSIRGGVLSSISRLERWPSRAEVSPPRGEGR